MYVGFIMHPLRNYLCNPFCIKENLLPFRFLTLKIWTQRIQLLSLQGSEFYSIQWNRTVLNIFTLKK